jgi:hypothetical protein
MIADGGEAISELAVLRNQPGLFGGVASNPTAWRTLEAVLRRHSRADQDRPGVGVLVGGVLVSCLDHRGHERRAQAVATGL